MSDITMCTLHSEKPYYITEINKNIYSIEELNYYLYNYLYLVDEEFFSESLIDYIENELDEADREAEDPNTKYYSHDEFKKMARRILDGKE